MCLLLLIPAFTLRLQQQLLHLLSRIQSAPKHPNARFLLTAVLIAGLFYLVRVKYFFLGDFNLRMEQIMRGETLFTEYLTMKCLYAFAKTLESIGLSNRSSFELFSCMMGAVFVYSSCRIAWLLGSHLPLRLVLTLAQVVTPMVLVFCGYIEIYAMPYAALSLFLYTGVLYLKTGKGMLYVLISLGFAIACHLLCAACAPAVLVLWYNKHPNSLLFYRRLSPVKKTSLILLVVFFGYFFILHSGNGFLIPLQSSTLATPTFLSVPHVWELLNGQILSSGLFFCWFIFLGIKVILTQKQLPPSLLFLLVTAGSLLALISVLDLQRGSGDWDIMAIAAVPIQLGTVLLIRNQFTKKSAMYLLGSCLGMQGLQSTLWIHTQHSDVSIQKIKSMLVSDPASYYKARMSGRLQVVALYQFNKLETEAQKEALIECNLKYLSDCRSCVMYAESIRKQGKKEETALFYETLLQKNPNVPEAYLSLFEYYDEKANDKKLNVILNTLFDAFSRNPNFFLTNLHVKPPIYLMLFQILFNEERNSGNTERIQKIYLTIKTLEDIVNARKEP